VDLVRGNVGNQGNSDKLEHWGLLVGCSNRESSFAISGNENFKVGKKGL